MNAETWRPVATSLLGSWPSQVAAWGREALAAYLAELDARGVTPELALVAIRSCPASQKFPPSAPELAALARRDPSAPTFEEAFRLIYGSGGVLRTRPLSRTFANEAAMLAARNEAAEERACQFAHPLVASFVQRYGVGRLRALEVDHPDFGELRRKELREAWERHCAAMEGREVAALASGRRDGLARLDPLAALVGRPQISSGE